MMVSRIKNIVDPSLSKEPAIGPWLWAIQDSRQRTMEELDGMSPAIVDWLPPDNESAIDESTIGIILYHLANIEVDWLYVEVLEQPYPAAVEALFPYPTRDEQGHLTQVQGISLEDHLKRLETVRELLLAVFQPMELSDFHRARSLPHYDVTPEWVHPHFMDGVGEPRPP